MSPFFLLLIDWSKLRPENLFGGQVLERTPAGLTIIYSIGVGVLLVILLVSFLENFRRPKFIFERDLPHEVARRITQTRANRSLMVWLGVFVVLAFFVYGFQVYWTRYADDTNEQFQALSYKDLRNRRVNAASLRGWMLDRTGKLNAALAYYKIDKDGDIVRNFPLEKEMAHLLGTERDTRNKPLLSRSTREYYTPGSTFKTLTMMSAFRAGKHDFIGTDLAAPDCYTPFKGSRPICDAGGSCEICSPSVPLREAFKVSSNQYFAELGNFLGRERMGETARLVGIAAVDKREEALTQGYYKDIWNTSDTRIANALKPARSTMVVGKELTLYDFGLEGMGQCLASQMTPFQMALIASTPANLHGMLMMPKIEFDLQPKMYSQVLTPQQAAAVREIMSTVTEEAGGTGGVVKSKLAGTGIMAGGKTGTAEKEADRYDPKTGERMFVLKHKKDENGETIEYKDFLSYERTDGWFICIAPLENPQLAVAVVIEDIGNRFGGQTAAPVAADVILKARELGLLGEKYKSAAPPRQPVLKKRK